MSAAAVRCARTSDLMPSQMHSARALMDAAFDGDFSDDDWAHALGGWHAIVEDGEAVIAHAAVVPRTLMVGDRPVSVGYVEAVAVTPARQRTGLGSAVMRALHDVIRRAFAAGVLSTGEWPFYESLDWTRWQGESFVREAGETGWGDWEQLVGRRYPDATVYRLTWGAKELKSLAPLAARSIAAGAEPSIASTAPPSPRRTVCRRVSLASPRQTGTPSARS